MTFIKWIDNTGIKKVARQLKVDPSTVSNWKHSKRFPRPKMLLRIHHVSNAKVSFKEMITHFSKATK